MVGGPDQLTVPRLDSLPTSLDALQDIISQAEQPSYQHHDEVSCKAWRDALGRLRSWTANTGALRNGEQSLGFKLRNHEYISEEVASLLHDMVRVLEKVKNIVSNNEPLAGSDNEGSRSPSGDFPEEFSDDDSDDSMDDESIDSKTELQHLYGETVNIMTCLNKMAMLVPDERRPVRRWDITDDESMDDAESVGRAPSLITDRGTSVSTTSELSTPPPVVVGLVQGMHSNKHRKPPFAEKWTPPPAAGRPYDFPSQEAYSESLASSRGVRNPSPSANTARDAWEPQHLIPQGQDQTSGRESNLIPETARRAPTTSGPADSLLRRENISPRSFKWVQNEGHTTYPPASQSQPKSKLEKKDKPGNK